MISTDENRSALLDRRSAPAPGDAEPVIRPRRVGSVAVDLDGELRLGIGEVELDGLRAGDDKVVVDRRRDPAAPERDRLRPGRPGVDRAGDDAQRPHGGKPPPSQRGRCPRGGGIMSLTMIIDTHTHFYDPTRPQGVPWPPPDDTLLYRRVMPDD